MYSLVYVIDFNEECSCENEEMTKRSLLVQRECHNRSPAQHAENHSK